MQKMGVKGDTFPMTWADDGALYASCGDPIWDEKSDGLAMVRISGYLQFSGSWGDSTGRPLYGDIVPTPYYRSHVRPFRLTMR